MSVCILDTIVVLYCLGILKRQNRKDLGILNMSFLINKYTGIKRLAALFSAIVLLICLSSCGKETVSDPHAGMVSVSDGAGGVMWVHLYNDLPVSTFSSTDFYSDGTYTDYNGTGYTAKRGIDVSEHQGVIDWQAVHDDGVQFAIIRAGYRGYSEGGLFEDTYFTQNIKGALAAGIKVGVYFFSQAVSTQEATDEAEYLLTLISGYNISLPVFFDWEYVTNDGETRTEDVSGSTITDCCLAFCSVVESAGYKAGVYFYRSLGYYDYELDRLSNLVFWASTPGEYPDFYYKHSMWQYSCSGTVKGIEGSSDLNLLFEELPVSSASSVPSITPGENTAPEVTMPVSSAIID